LGNGVDTYVTLDFATKEAGGDLDLQPS